MKIYFCDTRKGNDDRKKKEQKKKKEKRKKRNDLAVYKNNTKGGLLRSIRRKQDGYRVPVRVRKIYNEVTGTKGS